MLNWESGLALYLYASFGRIKKERIIVKYDTFIKTTMILNYI